MENVTLDKSADEEERNTYNYWALVFGVLLILVIILGNILVCLSVLTERSLKTATNYFIISLAVADLLLAVLVLPLFVYSEFLGGVWPFSTFICDALMTMDVLLCTASILNLCAISVDRYIAVVLPLKYNRNQFSVRQLVLITATWVLSFGVASPVIFGLNQVPDRDPAVCKLEDNNFVVYSSVCSFFVPCPVMLLLYFLMFRGLQRWRRQNHSRLERGQQRTLSLQLSFNFCQKKSKSRSVSHEKVLNDAGLSPATPSVVSVVTPSGTTLSCERDVALESETVNTQLDNMLDSERKTSERSAERQLKTTRRKGSKSSRVSGRERKAMKVLPIVVGFFLVCWTPFFIVHVTKVLCDSCNIGSTLISVVTWLGYVNSAVNPIIYTAFNAEFRNVFQKLLCCST
ncbi:dopamine receptor D4 related sequence [Synchiropus picturatus]